MWKKVLVRIPQRFIKITVTYKKAHRNFHGIPLTFFTEFRQSFPMKFHSAEFRGIFHRIPRNIIRWKNSAEFHGIFQTEFLRNSGIPYEKFDGNIIPPEFFFDGIMYTLLWNAALLVYLANNWHLF